MNTLLVALVAAVSFGAVGALAIAASYPHIRTRLLGLSGERRGAVLLALLAAPLLGGLVLSLLALLPGLVGFVWPGLDHCPHHDDAHFHLCLVHTPAIINLGLSCSLVLAVVIPASLRLGRTAVRLRRARRVVRALSRTAEPASCGHSVVASQTPFALTAGLFTPRVYVAQRLLDDLDPPSTAAMLAHESAHVRRRDPLRKLVGELFAALHLPSTSQRLLEDLSLACEEACDEAAAAQTGDRDGVAAALVALGRLLQRAPAEPVLIGAAFGGANIDARVRSLLAPRKADPAVVGLGVVVAMGILLATVLTVPLHHVTETLLGALLG